MTFTKEQLDAMVRDAETMCVQPTADYLADVRLHVKALAAEVEILQRALAEVQEARIAAAVEGSEWKAAFQSAERAAGLDSVAVDSSSAFPLLEKIEEMRRYFDPQRTHRSVAENPTRKESP